MIDEFLIDWSQDLEKEDFEKNGEGMFLKQEKGYELIQSVNELLDKKVEHQRITDFGEKSKIKTIIREESVRLAQFLRGETQDYCPHLEAKGGGKKMSGHTSLEDLAEENIGEFETDRLEYVLKTLDEADQLENGLIWHSSIWKNLTIEELIGGLIEAENLLQRSKEENE